MFRRHLLWLSMRPRIHYRKVTLRGHGALVRVPARVIRIPIFRDPPPAYKVVCHCASNGYTCYRTNNCAGYAATRKTLT